MTIERKSPVHFPGRQVRTENRQNWTVVLEYESEGAGPWLVDLSHCPKWDIQDSGIAQLKPFGLIVPDAPGKSSFQNGVLVNRMNRTQVSVWFLHGQPPETFEGKEYTETTEGQVLLGLLGRDIFPVTEKLTSLYFSEPGKTVPFLLQGPLSHVPCQIVVLERDGRDGVLLLACSRGYAHDMVHAILDAGKEYGLQPAGEEAFERVAKRWMEKETVIRETAPTVAADLSEAAATEPAKPAVVSSRKKPKRKR